MSLNALSLLNLARDHAPVVKHIGCAVADRVGLCMHGTQYIQYTEARHSVCMLHLLTGVRACIGESTDLISFPTRHPT